MKIHAYLIILLAFVMLPTSQGFCHSYQCRKEYDDLDRLDFGDSCSWEIETWRLHLFSAVRKVSFENLTESEILRIPTLMQPNTAQLMGRAKGSHFCDSNKNLICDQGSLRCRCAVPSFRQDGGRCVLPKGAGCPILLSTFNSVCTTGTTCKFVDDGENCFGDVELKVSEKLLNASMVVFGNFVLRRQLQDDSYQKFVETDMCNCSE